MPKQQSHNHNATTTSDFLISGAITNTTGVLPCLGMRDFTIYTEGVANGGNANGTVTIQGRVNSDASWFNLQNINFTNSSGASLLQFNNPLESVQAIVSSRLSGAFNVAYCIRG
jgi:hypothetical protein